jgi:hypothetical protein
MFRLFVKGLLAALLLSALAACASRPKPVSQAPIIYDIRAVAVTSNTGTPRALIRGVQANLSKSVAGTARPVPLPQAVMNVRIVATAKHPMADGVRAQAEVSVMLSDLNAAHAIDVRNFLIYSFSISPATADSALADAIASRLRYEYSLAIPPIRVATAPSPRLSTRMRSEDAPAPSEEKPIVIPLKTAPVIGADQDPILNSKTPVVAPKEDAAEKPAPAENALEAGAKAKVVILPKPAEAAPEAKPAEAAPEAKPADSEPCVETLDKKCD